MTKWTAENIKSLRLRLGWSSADFARHFGCLSELIVRWERGEVAPSGDDFLQFDRLAFHLESHNEQMSRQPIAECCLKESGTEQIHSDKISELYRNQ